MLIYKATNIINGKIYIGQTSKTLEYRKREHFKQVNNNSQLAFHRAIRKYGKESFSWGVIDSANTLEELSQKEMYWISFYNSYILSVDSNGYNMTLGGEGAIGRRHSKETRALMKERKIGVFDGNKNPMYGKSHSEESRQKISQSLKGKGLGSKNPRAKTVVQLTLDGEFIAEYDNAKEVAVSVFGAVNATNIYSCCNGKRRTAYGFIWMNKDDYTNCSNEEIKEISRLAKLGQNGENHPKSKAVVKLDLHGNYIGEYESATKGAESVNGNRSEVAKCCRKKGKYKGFKFLYKDDYDNL